MTYNITDQFDAIQYLYYNKNRDISLHVVIQNPVLSVVID